MKSRRHLLHAATTDDETPYNVVLTHCTADFDSLASAVGLAKLWSTERKSVPTTLVVDDVDEENPNTEQPDHYSTPDTFNPTYVVLPRGAHPGVAKFLSLHKHLFPIKSLRDLPNPENLDKLGLVDAQRRERIGPAGPLLAYAKRITVVDHHVESNTDIPEAEDYVVDNVGSVTTLIVEKLRKERVDVTPPEATLLALGIHADTGSLCFDSTTPRDATALAWAMRNGASQAAIAEHAHSTLSTEQQLVLTQSLAQINTTHVDGVSVSTVLLRADGFINGLAAVTKDVLDLSSSDVLIMAVIYDSKSKTIGGNNKNRQGGGGGGGTGKKGKNNKNFKKRVGKEFVQEMEEEGGRGMRDNWKMGVDAERRKSLMNAFEKKDVDGSGYLDSQEIKSALKGGGVVASEELVDNLMEEMDKNRDGRVDFEEFFAFAKKLQLQIDIEEGKVPATMILIGRAKAGFHLKSVNLAKLFEEFGGGGHAKAASATTRLADFSEGKAVLQRTLDKLIVSAQIQQPIVRDFMTSPVLVVNQDMVETDVEELFQRSSVRALPVVNEKEQLVGMVTYKELAAAQTRYANKVKKKQKQMGGDGQGGDVMIAGTKVKAWMLQHVRTVATKTTLSDAEKILLEGDFGVIPVVDGEDEVVVGLITRTDLLRQHQYYDSGTLHYNNKAFADRIADRKPLVELRKKLKEFDLEE
ncbi:hypothetical protein TrVE_jg5384 [Triparma verrucosa]|uniref:Calmodulin n=1 Tax=Triparma verrucosa TaxID=1606542 RepID=A0A9W7EK07_9STRA|nr:hypothetical protein TrVE_jg5384 [Triparma verrucosa]